MDQELFQASLRESVKQSIGNFLFSEGFKVNEILRDGILEIINLISDYHEEGTPLLPHVIITNNLKFFETIPNKEIAIREALLTVDEFKEVIKLCAPLAINNWIIFIEVRDTNLKYGIISAEMTETSLSIHSQTVGKLGVKYEGITIAYLRNVGKKTVELSGLAKRLLVSLTLEPPATGSFSEIWTLSQIVASECQGNYKNLVATFFDKIINEALRTGHGNLIAVIRDDDKGIEQLKAAETNCVYLPNPIDFQSLFIEAETARTNETSINLISYASILQSMLNHDGITILTSTGRVIGYHLLIKTHSRKGQIVGGGTRSKAFASIENCGHFCCCFFKSQDGNTKIFTS